MPSEELDELNHLAYRLEEAVLMMMDVRLRDAADPEASDIIEHIAYTAAVVDIAAWGIRETRPEESRSLLESICAVVETAGATHLAPLADIVSGTQYWTDSKTRSKLRDMAF